MNGETHQKVKASHLKRDAYLYIRESTIRQVFENTESTKRQYGLRERAVALGWPLERHPRHRQRSGAIRSLGGGFTTTVGPSYGTEWVGWMKNILPFIDAQAGQDSVSSDITLHSITTENPAPDQP